ncbi:MAG: TonB-dependent receptor plug domain-containing protein, partial [Thermoanaerobaculia bacterium]|nr:TonB-dependent receptor plug domain-containing protein [Thermoanaerobaculia bacterium]
MQRTLPAGADRPSIVAVIRLLLAALLLLGGPLAAQETGSLVGRVTTADGEPVTDAVVTAVVNGRYALADASGEFRLDGIPVGLQVIEISSARHARDVERVQIAAGETTRLDVQLVSQSHAEQIVVTATPDSRGELDLAAPVNVLDDLDLALRVEPSIGETLAQEAGVSSTYFAPGASRPVIRGLGGDRVKMMENGLDSLDASSASPDHAVSADPLSADRVEVLRGPATLLYGSSAIGGVVNTIDRRIPERVPADALTGIVDLRGGTVADERSAAIRLDGGGGRWAWHGDLLTRETDDYEIPGRASLDEEEDGPVGILPNSDVSTDSGGVGVSYVTPGGFVGMSVRGFDSNYGIPG